MADEVTSEPTYYGVRVSEAALVQLCHAGLEAYLIPGQVWKGKKRKALLETYGQLWGHKVKLDQGHTIYAIEMVTVDTTALHDTTTSDAWVQPDPQALNLKRDLMEAYWPQWEFLGNFHSHPYETVADAASVSGHCMSSQDFHWIESSQQFLENDFRVALVLTIAKLKNRLRPKADWIEDYTAIKFTISNYRFWLKAYVAQPGEKGKKLKLSDHNGTDRYIECPSLVGMRYPYTQFGKRFTAGHTAMK